MPFRTYMLHPHPDHLPSEPFAVEASVVRRAGGLDFRYCVCGPVDLLSIPRRAASSRRDGLWQHSCFEAFVRDGAGLAYVELNFSPSTEWAAYQFTSPRVGMRALSIGVPRFRIVEEDDALEMTAAVELQTAGDLALNLAAVIEEKSGTKSYWALAHPSDKPDFHHPNGFVLTLLHP